MRFWEACEQCTCHEVVSVVRCQRDSDGAGVVQDLQQLGAMGRGGFCRCPDKSLRP